MSRKAKVAVNGYGVIGKRVADAIRLQDDMVLTGISDVAADWRMRIALKKGIDLYGVTPDVADLMRQADLDVCGALGDLLRQVDVVVDCTPRRFGARNVEVYRQAGIKFIVEGGEQHAVAGHSFVAEANYASALGRQATRIVSCNTTSIVRTLTALKRAGLLGRARGTLLRRATDPWESHLDGIMNTVLPEARIPSHQAEDAQSVDPEFDVVTMAAKVPETIGHLHYWTVQLTRPVDNAEIIAAFRRSSRIALIRWGDGLSGINTVVELMADLGRPREDLYEVALWEDMLAVRRDEAFYAYLVDNQAIVIPETIDAIRALTELEADAAASIAKTNAALGITDNLVGRQHERTAHGEPGLTMTAAGLASASNPERDGVAPQEHPQGRDFGSSP
jgi:glyceraldehyde-3-phosphate dehydrogenase (NAD(P))